MYIGFQGDKIKYYGEKIIDATLYKLDRIEETELEYILDGDKYVLKDEEWEHKEADKEHERLQALSMTRSDFFDAMILAFNLNEAELRVVVEQVIGRLNVADNQAKIALNNYDNALNFYRKHALFDLLNNVEIQVNDELTLVFTSEIWDKFFDTKDYTELYPAIK